MLSSGQQILTMDSMLASLMMTSATGKQMLEDSQKFYSCRPGIKSSLAVTLACE